MGLSVEWLYFLLTVVGASASVWFITEKVFRWRRVSWRCAQKSAENIAGQLTADAYMPSLIIGIGRGGAIFGAMISGCLGHRPLLVIDRKYIWKDGRRLDDMILHVDIPKEMLGNVLLVAGEVHTGNTIKLYFDYFHKLGAQHIRRAVFFLQVGSTEKVEYWGFRSKTDRRMPWMFSRIYRRDSRNQEEACSLAATDVISRNSS